MQTLIQVVCSERKSLRDVIAHDEKLWKYNFYVEAKQKPGRSPGWAKIHSVNPSIRGAINISWQSRVKILTCRVITKGTGKPATIIGDFLKYLLARFSRSIESIIIVPR
ncbi:MAG TPA: hypothetical protein VLH59_00880 [Ignavibacteriaceae bacterium]|nr:hypothetical protein [Ignavibacteriaceae bacterium]